MTTSPGAATAPFVSAIFSNLLDFLKNKAAPTAIQGFLTSAGINDDVATMITQAITQGGQVSLPTPQSYQLGDLLNPFLPSGFQVPDQWASITLTLVTFNADPANEQLALSGTVTIPLSLAKLSTQVDFTFNLTGNGAPSPPVFTAAMTGEIALTNSQLSLAYNLVQTDQTLDLQWLANEGDELQLSDLAVLLDGTLPEFPDGLDLHLTMANAAIDLTNEEESLELSALSGESAAAFVLVEKVSDSWELACGVAQAKDVSKWPCIGASFEKLDLTFDAAEVLVATASFPGFQWPAVDQEQGSLFEAFPFDLASGIAILAILNLTEAGDGTVAKNVAGLAASRNNKTDEQIGKLLLSAQLQTPIVPNLTVTFGSCDVLKYPIDLSLSITMAEDLPDFSASGSITFSQWNNLVADVSLNITDDSIYGVVNVAAPPPYALLSGTKALPGLAINELAGLMGIDFASQELVLGFVGKFDLGTISQADSNADPSTLNAMLPSNGLSTTMPQPNAGELAVIVGLNDDLGVVPVPDVDLLILRLTELDLTDVINVVIANPNSDAVAALSGISLEDILFYWCDVPTGTYYLPDGTVPSTGFKIHGMLDFWGKFEVWGELEFDAASGFDGSVFLSPIKLGDVLSITGAPPPDPNPVPSSFETGGPWIEVSTAGPNFLAGSWDIQVLDIVSTDLNITISEQIFSFSIASNDSELFTDDFLCQLTAGWTQLLIAVNGNLQGDVPLPSFLNVPQVTLHLDTQYSVSLNVGLSNGTTTFSVNGNFLVGTDQVNLPNLTVTASISKFADIPDAILQAIKDNTDTLFNSAVKEATSLIDKWGEDVLNHIKDGVKDVVYLLLHIHHAHTYGESWLKAGNLVSGDGVAKYQLAQSNDQGSSWVRRWIPDVPTLDDLQGRCKCQFVTPDSTNESGSQLLIDSLPIDTLQVPSRIDGTIIQEEENGDLYLIAQSPPDKNGVTVPGKYQVQNSSAFLAAAGRNASQICAKSDINQIPDNTVLSKQCTITGGGTEQDAFVDGIRYWIPDPYTEQCLQKSFQKPQALDSTTFASLPSGPTLIAASQNALLKCGDPIYLVDNNQLRQFQDMESLQAYGYNASTAQNITTTQLGIMSIGSKMPENPPG